MSLKLVSKPELLVDGIDRRDVIQEIHGDYWLLSTCVVLAKKVWFSELRYTSSKYVCKKHI